MPTDLAHAITAVLDRLRTIAADDPGFAEQLRLIAAAVVEPVPKSIPVVAVVAECPPPPPPVVVVPRMVQPAPAVVQPPVLVGGPPTTVAVAPRPVAADVTATDLPLVGQRLRLKAEGTRWAVTRRRRLAEGADFDTEIDPVDRQIIERAKKLPDCFLWMNHPSTPLPSDTQVMDDLAGCYDTTADAVDLVRAVLGGESPQAAEAFERSLELAAEAQSALRGAVEAVGQRQDTDQLRVYQYLREECFRSKFYIRRHMRLEDGAVPTTWPGIAERVREVDDRVQAVRRRTKDHQAGLNKVRYHLKAIVADPTAEHPRDWAKVIGAVDTLVANGMPPSNVEVRDLLLPVVDAMPDADVPPTVQRVLAEIDAFLASRSAAGEAEPAAAEPTAQVKAAAELLRGRTVVLIGGVRRPAAHEALRRAFDLKQLDWVETRPHESVTTFESHVARADVAVVLLAIRWSSHGFADVQAYCDRYGRPLVRLPAGYNPNQVAAQILSQCGDRLTATPA